MAFLRFSRDKRGYENFYLVETSTNRRGKTRARVLYWFRTPPGVKVGREPFDADIRRALEAQNPNIVFDWRKIAETPIPSADAERWRERRRLERAERAQRRSAPDADGETPGGDIQADDVQGADEFADEVATQGEDITPEDQVPENLMEVAAGAQELRTDEAAASQIESPAETPTFASDSRGSHVAGGPSRRRRRRHRRAGHRRPDRPSAPDTIPSPVSQEGAAKSNGPVEDSGSRESRDSNGPDEV